MKTLLVTIPDPPKHYEIWTPVRDGVKDLITCKNCVYSVMLGVNKMCCKGPKAQLWDYQKDEPYDMLVNFDDYCSWGEARS